MYLGRRVPVISTIAQNSHLPTDKGYAEMHNNITSHTVCVQSKVGKFDTINSNIQ